MSRQAAGVSSSSSKTVTQSRSCSIPYTSVTSSYAHRTASALKYSANEKLPSISKNVRCRAS